MYLGNGVKVMNQSCLLKASSISNTNINGLSYFETDNLSRALIAVEESEVNMLNSNFSNISFLSGPMIEILAQSKAYFTNWTVSDSTGLVLSVGQSSINLTGGRLSFLKSNSSILALMKSKAIIDQTNLSDIWSARAITFSKMEEIKITNLTVFRFNNVLIYVSDSRSLVLSNSLIFNGTSQGKGAAIILENSDAIIESSVFSNLKA